MTGERVTTTTVPEGYTDAMASDIDTITQATPADVRGNVEIDASFTSFSFIKDLGEAPAYANQHVDKAFLAEVGSRALIPMAAMPGEKSVETKRTSVAEVERKEPASEKIDRGLGARALDAVRGFRSKVNTAYYNGFATVVGAIPTAKSKQEMLDLSRERKEEYADKPGDGYFTRKWNAIRRNKYEIAAWTPAAALGSIAMMSLAWKTTGIVDASLGGHYNGTANGLPVSYEITPLAYGQPMVIPVGGHTQGLANESGYTQSLIDAGIINPGSDNVRPVDWSAQMAPVSGDTMRMDASDAEGAQQIFNRYTEAKDNGSPVKIVAFSQGTEATARALNMIADQNGGTVPDNVEVILIGSPSGINGLGANPGAAVANPFLSALGMETNVPIPPGAHVTVRTDIADVFGNGGNQSLSKLAEMAVGPGHRVIGPENGVLISREVRDGVTYEVWGDPDGINDPLMRALRDQGAYITPEADRLMGAVLPYGTSATGPVYGTSDGVINALGPAIDSYTGNSGAGTKAVDAVFADPGLRDDIDDVLGLTKIPDLASNAMQHPEQAAQNINEIGAISTDAVNSGIGIVNNPDQAIDATNRALEANGVPGVVPHVDEMRNIANNVAIPVVQQITGVSLPQVPVLPQITPLPGNIAQNPAAIMPTVQSSLNAVSSLLGGLGRR